MARFKASSQQRRALTFERLEVRQLLAVATLKPDADTYLGAGVGGEAASAEVFDILDLGDGGNDRIAYVRFDLSGYEIDTLESATLTFYKQPASRNDTIVTPRFKNYGLTNAAGNTPQNWSEASLALGNVGEEYTNVGGNLVDVSQLYDLDADGSANVFESVNNVDGAPQTLTGPDLVAFLESRIADNGLATFVTLVDAGSNSRGWGYGTSENSDPALRPKLEITYDGEVAPDPYPEIPVRFSRQVEDLNRGVVALRQQSQVYVGWRMLGTDPADVAFNLYRSTGSGPAVKLNGTPLTTTTDYQDTTANVTQSNEYFVRPVIDGIEMAASESFVLPAFSPIQQFLNVPLQIPAGGMTPANESYTYNANDASVGDLDGDGDYEIVLKWDPTNSKDNSQGGCTGSTILDAYQLDGTLLWRIDLGQNIRSGAHYTQFMVYDLDGDGRAEVAMKTAPGTIDGQGNPVLLGNDQVTDDYRNGSGYILTGPEYFTIFDGLTGAELETISFPLERISASTWGDSYGNRVDRYLGSIAYLDGERPSLVWARGYYGPQGGFQARNEVVALDWRDGNLTQRWRFNAATNGVYPEYIAQGSNALVSADVDGDGYDEIIHGAAALDHDGSPLYSTGLGHGDALHVSDMDPSNPGLEVYMVHESPSQYGPNGAGFRDAQTGEIIYGVSATNDVGRGVAADIDPNSPGYESWATTSDPNGGPRYIYGADGQPLYETPSNMFYNFVVWWDADLTRELLDGTTISEWNNPGRSNFDLNPAQGGTQQYAPNSSSNNGTKSTPALSADILGDWREEVIWRRSDNTALQIFTTTIPASNRLYTLMHDTQYREAIAGQNVAYNQPPHPSFFLGAGMATTVQPDVYVATSAPPVAGDFDTDGDVDSADLLVWDQTYGTTPSGGDFGDADNDNDADGFDFLAWQQNFSPPQTSTAAASSLSFPSAASTLSVGNVVLLAPEAANSQSKLESAIEESVGEAQDIKAGQLIYSSLQSGEAEASPARQSLSAESDPIEDDSFIASDEVFESYFTDWNQYQL